MTKPLLLVGLEGLHHDQRWQSLCGELGLDARFHAMSGTAAELAGIGRSVSGAMDEQSALLATRAREKLSQLIDATKPFAVHALGTHPAGLLCLDSLKLSRHKPRLIVQIRGGAEIELYRHSPAHEKRFNELFVDADVVIADNKDSYAHAKRYGFRDPLDLRFSALIPGNCGEVTVDIAHRTDAAPSVPLVVWPRANTNPNTDAYPILEAIARSWARGHRFKVVSFGATSPELVYFARSRFPHDRLGDFEVRPNTERTEFLSLVRRADILLSPSMFDGISNVLLEGMALGCLPIVSHHSSLPSELINLKSIEFADNLVVDQIRDAIDRTLTLPAPERYRRITQNAAWASKHCDRSAILSAIGHLYSQVDGSCSTADGN